MDRIETRLEFTTRPGLWLWIALGIGAVVRIFLIFATEGTHDVTIWQTHAGWTHQYGLAEYYGRSEVFNHPPFIAKLLSLVWEWAKAVDVPFRIPHRAIFTVFDIGNTWLLYRLFADSRWRFLVAATYWSNPLAILLASYHGNTDTAVAFAMLLAVRAAARGRVVAAGAAIGFGLWIKLPVILAVPALVFALGDLRKRVVFGASALVVASVTYLPTAIEAPALLFDRVIAYPGLTLRTAGGDPVWGIWFVLPAAARNALAGLISAHQTYNTWVVLAPVVLLAWLRRHACDARGLGRTLGLSLMIFYGFTLNWAYQYLAWSIPFWWFVGPGFVVAATVVLAGFVYPLYAFLCDGWLLTGPWAYWRDPSWPAPIEWMRNLALLFCAGTGVAGLVLAFRDRSKADAAVGRP